MANPATVHISVQNPCIGQQVVDEINPSLYAGGTGDFQAIYLFVVTIGGVTTWEMRTVNGPGDCASPLILRREPAANNPIGTYKEVGAGPAAAVVTEF